MKGEIRNVRLTFSMELCRMTPKAKPSTYTGYLKFALIFPVLLLLHAHARCQAPAPEAADEGVKPQIAIVVKKHPTGADLVDVTALDPKYPPALLEKQVNAMCQVLNTPARGLSIYKVSFRADNPNLDFLRASFGTAGLIEDAGHYNLASIAEGFAGAPAPYTVSAILVTFQGEIPVADSLMSFASNGVRVSGKHEPPPDEGVEYRIRLLSQDPKEVSIPDRYQVEEPVSQPPAAPPQSKLSWSFWVALALASLAVGALVYLALLRFPSHGRKPPSGSTHK